MEKPVAKYSKKNVAMSTDFDKIKQFFTEFDQRSKSRNIWNIHNSMSEKYFIV